jgi:hypothetical protein
MYKAMMNVGHVNNKTLWNLKMPLKIKIFMWYLIKGVVLTKDLAKRTGNEIRNAIFVVT